MHATLILNGNAGSSDGVDIDALHEALVDAGYDPACHATETEDDLDALLADIDGLVVAAGGDGTFREIARRLLGRDVPLAILPLGTANNIASGFGVSGDPTDLLSRLDDPRERPLDAGRVCGPWGEDVFFEAMGIGLYAEVLKHYEPERGKSVRRAATTIREVVLDHELHPIDVRIDGDDASGSLVALQVLNTRAMGPRMHLAPDADPCDGRFDVVRIAATGEVSLVDYLAKLVTGEFDELDNVEVRRAERVELDWDGRPIHLDAEVREDGSGGGPVVATVLTAAIRLWLPREA